MAFVTTVPLELNPNNSMRSAVDRIHGRAANVAEALDRLERILDTIRGGKPVEAPLPTSPAHGPNLVGQLLNLEDFLNTQLQRAERLVEELENTI